VISLSKKGKAKPRRDAYYWVPECASLKGDEPNVYCERGFMEMDGCPDGCSHFIGKEADSDG
jgi:hypothetical protein